jgi:hypothetical protein
LERIAVLVIEVAGDASVRLAHAESDGEGGQRGGGQ